MTAGQPETPPTGDQGVGAESIARNTAFALATRVSTATFTAVLTLYLVRALGADDYGVFALALGVGGLLLLPADFGLSLSASRFVAENRGDRGRLATLIADSLRLKLLVSLVACGALAALADPIADAYGTPELEGPLRAVALAVFAQSFFLFFSSIFEALGRVSIGLRVVFVESLVEVSASIALVLLGAGATGAALGRGVGYAVGVVLALFFTRRLLGRAPRRTGGSTTPLGQIVRYAGALLIIDGVWTLFARVDVLLIGAYLGTRDVGLFEAPVRLVALLGYVGAAVAAGVAPRLTRGGDSLPDAGALRDSLRYLIVLQGALLAPVIVWAEPIVDLLLGDEYEGSAAALRALAPVMFLSSLAPLVSLGVTYLGEARKRIPIALGALALNAAIDVVLIPEIGIVGAAIGSGVAYAIYVPAHLVVFRRVLDLPYTPLLVALAQTLVAAAAMAGVLALMGTGDVALWVLFPGTLAGLVVYAGVALGLGAVSAAEVGTVAGRLRRRA